MNLRIATILIAWMPLVLAAGCRPGEGEFRQFGEGDDVENVDPPDHHHADHGPHGGHLAELGGEDYHAEVVFDEETRELTVYLLERDVETALPVDAGSVTLNLQLDGPVSLELPAAPLEGETDASSRFTLSGDAVPEAIQDEEDLKGSVVVMIDGQQYRGEIIHDHHHDHGHDHPH